MKKTKNHSSISSNKKKDPSKFFAKPIKPTGAQIRNQTPATENTNFYKNIKFLDWAMVIFSGVLAVYAVLTYGIYKQQLAVYQNQLIVQKLDQRAWVEPTEITPLPNTKNPTILKIIFKNTGKTPAIDVCCDFNGTDDPKIIPKTDEDIPASSERGVLEPGGTIKAPLTVKKKIIKSMRDGTQIYIWGTIWYKDIFGNKHWTQFCFCSNPDLTFGFCPGGRHSQTDDSPNQYY